MGGELLILAAVFAVLGLCAWLEERTRRVSDLHRDDWQGEQGTRR